MVVYCTKPEAARLMPAWSTIDGSVPLPAEMTLLVVTGVIAGALNVVAGGGSFLTLPLLLFLGLPAPVANASNRVGVLAQNVSGLWTFHRYGVIDWRWSLLVSLPALAGAAAGAWLSLVVSAAAFTRILSFAMLGVTIWSVAGRRGRSPSTAPASASSGSSPPIGPLVLLGFLLVGVYGGFVQAGVGFFLLAITSACGIDLLRGNAVKLLVVLIITLLSLGIFASAGTVDWVRGGALAAGNFAGGVLGARLALLKGQQWLERVVTATVIVFAVLLLLQ
ncbi:MAG: sulfite exporter TauE/SafE family protein [Vicinamibacterales bacterium]